MSLSEHLGKHAHDVNFGGNWTVSNMKEVLEDVTWEQATQEVYAFNTIATLVFHIGYFVKVAVKVLEGGPLEGNDKLSFDHPPIHSEADWQQLLDTTWSDAERFSTLVKQLPDSRLTEDFADPKYGSYFRNLQGIVEHTHYHLGQIVIFKKLIQQGLVS